MEPQLWVPVPKLQSSKPENKKPEEQPKPPEVKRPNLSKNGVSVSSKPDSEKKSTVPKPTINISKVLHNQDNFNLDIKINKKRTLNDLLDDDEDEFSVPSKPSSMESTSVSAQNVPSNTERRPDGFVVPKVEPFKPDFKAGVPVSEYKVPKSKEPTMDSATPRSAHSSVVGVPKTHTFTSDKDVSRDNPVSAEKHSHKDYNTQEMKRHKSDGHSATTSEHKHTKSASVTPSVQEAKQQPPKDKAATDSLTGLVAAYRQSSQDGMDVDKEVQKDEQAHKKDTKDEVTPKPDKVDTKSEHKEVKVKKEVVVEKVEVKEEKVKKELKVKLEESPKRDAGKKEKKVDPLVIEDTMEPINRWWEEIDDDMDYNKGLEFESRSRHWTYLEHNGMIFTPEYVPHKVPIKFKGETVELPPHVEEIATMWAQSMGTNYETSDIYCKNFWTVFSSKFDKTHPIRKAKLADVDFSLIKNHLEEEKLKKKENKEFYKAKQQEDAKREYRFNYALVDWIREKVSSNKLEPPGLFKGRGLHPKQGLLKLRMFPKDVILNVSKDAPVPKVSNFEREGHCWKDIYHDNSVTWLAYYKDSINDQFKYMYLSAQSKFKGFHDFLKYNKARELKAYIEKIREDYNTKMLSLDMYERQIGTAIYLIDYLALRVGGEKDQDEADTVGCCSLRVEHLKFEEKKENTITLDFLGKDSIRYYNTVTLNDVAYGNLMKFCNRKKPNAEIFNLINTSKLNDYLKELMDGLSAKVFRTYNASITLQNQFKRLRSKTKKGLAATQLLNHTDSTGVKSEPAQSDTSRTSSSASSASTDGTTLTTTNSIDINNVDDLENPSSEGNKDKDKDTKDVTVDLSNVSELLQFYNYANREVAILCNHQRSIPKQHETSMSKLKAQADMLKEDILELSEYVKHVQSGSTKEFKFESKTKDANGNPRKLITKPGMKLDVAKNKLATLKKKQKDHVIKMRIKDSNKTVALGTSKINYMDPRITVAFCKRYEIPIEKVFNKSLRMKFPWAMYVRSDFTF